MDPEIPVQEEKPQGFISKLENYFNTLPQINKTGIIIVLFIIGALMLWLSVSSIINGKLNQLGPIITPTPTASRLVTPTDIPIPTPEFVQNELIVKYKMGMGPDEISKERKTELGKVYKELGITLEKRAFEASNSAFKNYYLLNLKTKLKLEEVMLELKALPEIENVEKNYINRAN